MSASERRRNTLKGFKEFDLDFKARIWPRQFYVCHSHSTAAASSFVLLVGGNSKSLMCRVERYRSNYSTEPHGRSFQFCLDDFETLVVNPIRVTSSKE